MTEPTHPHPSRPVAAVIDRQVLGGDDQVDRKAAVIEPGSWGRFDPFLLMFEDWFGDVGFDWHPHRGIETVTYVVEGELEHRDNSGGHGVLGPGDVQWMTAGRGIIHSELAHERHTVHTLQLWVNLPAGDKMAEPRYQDLRAADVPVLRDDGVAVRVYSGAHGDVAGPAQNHVPVTMLEVQLEPGATFVAPLAADRRGFAYVLESAGRFGPDARPARGGQVVWFDPLPTTGEPDDPADSSLEVVADGNLRFLFFSGPPLDEPVVAYGPFVMNTREQIVEAVEDYRTGGFGPVPTSAS